MENCLEKNGASIGRISSFVQLELPVLVGIDIGSKGCMSIASAYNRCVSTD
jgi:hypothetical protein